MKIEILGTGCSKCDKLEKNLEAALRELNIDATVEKVDNLAQIVSHGVMTTPALIIDGKVKAIGKVPSIKDIKKLLG